MIQPLRQRHRWMTILFFFIALSGLSLAVSSRVPIPVMDNIPGEVAITAENLRDGLWGDLSILMGWGKDEKGRNMVTLQPKESLLYPELLVYWHTGDWNGVVDGPAMLLGSLSGMKARRFMVSDKDGTLVLYSLAQGEVVAALRVENEGKKMTLIEGGLK